ncbi:UDP-glucuronic acid decarboxylase family protein [Lentisphaerota bacterium WC36G]|nr:SDR family oxidoreductase [Lentisphaerae bacterium WC36]
MRNILITGGAGFLGSHLCEYFIKKDDNVICLDNLYTGSLKNVEHLFQYENFTFINHDIIEPIDIEVDTIFNFACPASPPQYQKDPVFTFKTSVWGILNMLELAKKNNATIIQASTSEVYGNPLQHPQRESYLGNTNCFGKRSCYDEGKRSAESLMYDYFHQYGVDIKIARIFNTYGPRLNKDDGRVVSNFITQALRGEDITIYGDGEQTRSFCYVSDLIAGIIRLSKQPKEYTGPLNIGNPKEFTIKELAELIIKKINSNSKLVEMPLPADDPVKRRPDITKAKADLNWEPSVELNEGLDFAIEYYRTVL